MAGDAELFAAIRRQLYTAVVGDILDDMGYPEHFLPAEVRPLDPGMVVAGRAMPVVIRDGAGSGAGRFGKMLEALDSLRENDVYLTDGGQTPYALWGELLATRATHLKAAGTVANGYVRDTARILEIGFPTFCRGSWAQDMGVRGQVVDYNVPSTIGGLAVQPGDVVFGDRDGVLIVPRGLADEVFARALEKVQSENQVREAFRRGIPAVEAWKKYGVM